MGDVGNVLNIGVFEAQAVQGFERSAAARMRCTAASKRSFGLAWVSMTSGALSVTPLLSGR
jgi:hypothetical protein